MPLQPRQEVGDQVVAVGGGHHGVAGGQQPAHLRAGRLRQRRERQRPAPAAGRSATTARRRARTRRARRGRRRGTTRRPRCTPSRRCASEPGGALTSSSSATGPGCTSTLSTPGPGTSTRPAARARSSRLHSDGPNAGHGQVRLGAEVGLPRRRAVGREHLGEHRGLLPRGRPAGAEVGHLLPGHPGLHPVVAGAALQRPDPQRAAHRRRPGRTSRGSPGPRPGRVSSSCSASGLPCPVGRLPVVELVEHRGQLPLPAPVAGGVRRLLLLGADRDQQRQRVLAGLAHRAAAPAVDPQAALGGADADEGGVGHAGRPRHGAPDVEVALAVDLVGHRQHLAGAVRSPRRARG